MAKKKPKKLKKTQKIARLEEQMRILEERLSALEKRDRELDAIYEKIQYLFRDIDKLKSLLPDEIWDKSLMMKINSLQNERED
jgi:hypothetical protein